MRVLSSRVKDSPTPWTPARTDGALTVVITGAVCKGVVVVAMVESGTAYTHADRNAMFLYRCMLRFNYIYIHICTHTYTDIHMCIYTYFMYAGT